MAKPKRRANIGSRVWTFLCNDSITAWIVWLIIIFVLVKVCLFGGTKLLLGTEYPIVTVLSESMEHEAEEFDGWWNKSSTFYTERNITKEEFMTYPFRDGFRAGDVMVVRGVDASQLKQGQVIVYMSGKANPVIHRYIHTNVTPKHTYLITKGDNNPGMIITPELDERRVLPEKVQGEAILRIPYLGYAKIWMLQLRHKGE